MPKKRGGGSRVLAEAAVTAAALGNAEHLDSGRLRGGSAAARSIPTAVAMPLGSTLVGRDGHAHGGNAGEQEGVAVAEEHECFGFGDGSGGHAEVSEARSPMLLLGGLSEHEGDRSRLAEAFRQVGRLPPWLRRPHHSIEPSSIEPSGAPPPPPPSLCRLSSRRCHRRPSV